MITSWRKRELLLKLHVQDNYRQPKLIYDWVKQDAISLSEFTFLLNYLRDKQK